MPRIETLETGSSTQRDGLNHQAIEDYLKTIYALAETESPVSTSRLAEARQVKPSSVTNMIQRLNKLKLINYEKHYGVSLTDHGRRIALEVIRHHRLIELYLIEALGFSWDEVHEQADILEHVISEKLEDRIAEALGNPTIDPHGDPIPRRDGSMVVIDSQPLSTLAVGAKGHVARILNDENSEMLRYLAELGLIPGAKIEIMASEPFDGPFTVKIEGVEQVVGFTVATAVLVSLT